MWSQLHSSSIFHTELNYLLIIKFTCSLRQNLLGDQEIKVICEPLKAMRNLQKLKWVDVGATSQLTCMGGGGWSVQLYFFCLFIFSIHRVHHTFMNSYVPMTFKLVASWHFTFPDYISHCHVLLLPESSTRLIKINDNIIVITCGRSVW